MKSISNANECCEFCHIPTKRVEKVKIAHYDDFHVYFRVCAECWGKRQDSIRTTIRKLINRTNGW